MCEPNKASSSLLDCQGYGVGVEGVVMVKLMMVAVVMRVRMLIERGYGGEDNDAVMAVVKTL